MLWGKRGRVLVVVQLILFASLAMPSRASRLRAFEALDRKGRKEFPQSSQSTTRTAKPHHCQSVLGNEGGLQKGG
jgi:hypothetical protein